MLRSNLSRTSLGAVLAVFLLLALLEATPAMADAKSDLSIASQGACANGGTTFVITNNNPSRSVHATVAQRNADSTSTTLDISLPPGGQQVLGCAGQSAAGNFLVKWQVQSAQYQ